MSEIRSRFAPSPTGYLHLGSARTALFARYALLGSLSAAIGALQGSLITRIGLPVVIRPAFILGGKGTGIASTPEELERAAQYGLDASPIGEHTCAGAPNTAIDDKPALRSNSSSVRLPRSGT